MTTVNTSLTKINFLSQAQYEAIETPSDTELWAVEYTPKGFDLFDVKFTDHIINDVRWLRADTYGWHYGVYVDATYGGYKIAYNHLVSDIEGKQLETETIGGYTVSFYRADDGHKICPVNQVNILTNVYNAIGVAWYYILDTENERFKLPRSKYNFVGYRSEVGKYIEPGLPNITGDLGQDGINNDTNNGIIWGASGAFSLGDASGAATYDNTGTTRNVKHVNFDASDSNSIYGNSTTVQPPAVEMYLYFYVGEYTEAAIEETAGINAELLNDKLDRDLSNIDSTKADVVIAWQLPTADNNYTWYRKYKSGWVEQGGYIASDDNTDQHVTLLITMENANYFIATKSKSSATSRPSDTNTATRNTSFFYSKVIYNQSTTGFNFGSAAEMSIVGTYWEVKGVAATE